MTGADLPQQGYIYNNRNTFTEWYDGRDVPEEYRGNAAAASTGKGTGRP